MQKHNVLFCINIGIILLAAAFFSHAAGVPERDCGCTSMPAGRSSGVSAEKLIDCDNIMNGFAAGRERVKVIVNLAEPAGQKAKTDWTARQSLKLLQNKIWEIQNPVLDSLEPQEFKIRYRFENQAGFSGEVTLAGLEKLKNNPRVVSIEPVFMLEPHLRQGIPLMSADTYRSTYDGNGIAIAICDTGIDYTHPMLGNGGFPNSKVIGGYDYGDGDSDPMPHSSQAHGTCCAGIAAGDLNDTGDYIGGVAHNAKLYALKITPGPDGYASSDAMVAAWNWCVSHKDDDPNNPIMVISTSFGEGRHYSACDSYLPAMTTAADNAVAAGITVLASSGNDGYCDSIAWPSCISSVLSVGAVYDAAFGTFYPCVSSGSCAAKYPTTECSTGYYAIDNTSEDMVISYSNTASFLTLLTPSNQCYTTDIVGSGGYSSGDYDSEFSGTSAACPYAAGAVACLQYAAKDKYGVFLPPSAVKILLTSTGSDITDGKIGIIKPRIDLALAIDCIGPPVSFDFSVVAHLNTAITIALQAADDSLPNPPGDLNYIVVSLPAHGDLNEPNAGIISSVPHTLAGNASQVIYTPATDYIGPDSFTFKANDGGTPPDGGDSNSATVSITVNPPRSTFFYENFESGLGDFTIDNAFGDGSGLWHLTSVCNSVFSGHSAPNSIYYGRDIACDYNAGQTEGVVTSSDINLTGISAASLEFKYMLQTEQFPGYDIASVEISENGGAFTEYLSNNAGTLQDGTGGWISKTLDLSSMADSVIRVRFRFRTVDNLNNDYEGFCVDDVNVTGILTPQYTISGFIKNDCNLPVSGVVVDANNGGGSAPADANGRYEIAVNYGWSGTVTPSRLNYTFEPNLIGYNNVLTDIPDQNYVAVYIYDLNRNCTIGWGDVAVLAENWLQIGNGIAGDFDNDNYVDFIDFAEFGLIW